jgi:hypothetical protein
MNGFDKLFIYFCICRAQVEAKNINILVQVHKNVPIEIYGDRYRLEHVMNNLLSNAIKFSPDHSEICLSLSYETKVQHAVTFAVRDYGPGISNDDRQQLFQPFMQVRPGELQKGRGSGLGLSICKNMINLHRGSIDCTSVVRLDPTDMSSGGTEFFFTIPFDDSMQSKEVSSSSSSSSSMLDVTKNSSQDSSKMMIGIMSDELKVNSCATTTTTSTTTTTTTTVKARWDEYSSIVDVDRSHLVKGEVFRSQSMTACCYPSTGEYFMLK